MKYGNADTQGHDDVAEKDGKNFACEAFNVAPSFFQGKKSSMLRKFRLNDSSDFYMIMVNDDAVDDGYSPKLNENEYILLVDIFGDKTRLLSYSE